MKKNLPLLCLFVGLFSEPVAAQDTLTARQIIEKNIEAQGGRPALEAIRTVYTDFETVLDGQAVHFVIKEMLPNKGSFEIVVDGQSALQTFFDGKQGYVIVHGQKKADRPEDHKDEMYKKNIFNELDYLDTSLYTLTVLPAATVGQEQAYVISTRLRNGREKRIFYSKTTFLELKSETTRLAEEGSSEQTVITKQEKFQNITYPSVQRMFVGTDHEQTLKLVKIYFNEKVSESDFK